MTNQGLTITESAIARVNDMRAERDNSHLKLRIIVEGGGCSGFQYKLEWDETVSADDHVFNEVIVIDSMSLDILKGAKVDFVTNLMGQDFKIINPNAVSSCGCGTSFAI